MATLTVHCSRVIKAAEEALAKREEVIAQKRERLIDARMRRPKHWFTRQHPTRDEAIKLLKEDYIGFISKWDTCEFYADELEYHASNILRLAKANPYGYMELTSKDAKYLAPIDPPTQRTE